MFGGYTTNEGTDGVSVSASPQGDLCERGFLNEDFHPSPNRSSSLISKNLKGRRRPRHMTHAARTFFRPVLDTQQA
jgi:hypothetical protein